jgi:acyl-CoA thioester hydrolase
MKLYRYSSHEQKANSFYKGLSKLSTYQVKVPFRDVDMHGHVHNSAYICYFEEAITNWIEANDFVSDINPMTSEHRFFIKKIELTYHLPSHFNRLYKIEVSLQKLGKTSITLHCEMFDDSGSEPKLIVEETAVWVYVDKSGMPTDIVSPLRDKLAALV